MKSSKEPFGDPRLLGKKIIVKSGRLALEVAPKNPEVAPAAGSERVEKSPSGVLSYDQIVVKWAEKNEFHRQTEALATLLAEGGQELIAAYGAQRVADELFLLLKNPVDERTGLYMLIRALEPNVSKRAKLYSAMERSVDQSVDAYEEQLEALTTKDARAEFRAAQGGEYAPTEGNGKLRHAHIADYRAFDKNAFSVLGGVMEAVRPSVPNAKPAAKELQGHFDRKLFVRMVDGHGSLEKYVAARLVNEEETERYLEAHKAERLKELDREFTRQHNEIEAQSKEKIAAIEEEERELFGEHPFLASNAPDVVAWRDDAMRELFDRRVGIDNEMQDAVRAAFPSAYAVLDIIISRKTKAEALKKFFEENAEQITEIERPFRLRMAEIEEYEEQIVTPRVIPDSDAVKAARAVLKEKKAVVEREVQVKTNVFASRVITEIKKLKALNVKQDK